jgi:putative methionine-R-sulfoxide reductase with GAF domain
MDRNIGGLPDPIARVPSNRERRRRVRQKLHTPVYVSFNGPQTGMVVDLSELLDLHEDGFAVQTSEPLEANRAVTLCLDLPETKSYIHGSGQVIWSDETGRGGIRFSALAEGSRHLLKEWLFANLLIACSNHEARTEQLARHEHQVERLPEPAAVEQSSPVVSISGRNEIFSLETLRSEILEIGDNFDAVLQLIAERALTLTGACGTALAFLTDEKMICRARTGEPAPPLGAPLDTKQGLSGECVRSGLLVSCEDTNNDPRIDPEIGRTLGIGSLMAAPIVSDFQVVGLLEVLSPYPRAFTETHVTVLQRLVEMVPKIHREPPQPKNTLPENTQPETPIPSESASQPPASESGLSEPGATEFDSIPAIREALKERQPEAPERLAQQASGEMVSEQVLEQPSVEDSETASAAPGRLLYRALLGLTVAVVAVAAGYLLGPTIEKRWVGSPQASQRSLPEGGETVAMQRAADHSSAEQSVQGKSLPELRKLADQGDADAQWQMGLRYHNGEDVPRDDAQAMQWFLRAAEQGNVSAQSALGSYYWAGRGVPEDLSKAYMWSEIALAGGDENSKSRLEGLASQMTREQVSAANQQAEEWLHTHGQRAKSEAN